MKQDFVNAKTLNDRIRHLEKKMKESPSKTTLIELKNLQRMKSGQSIVIPK